MKHLSIWFCLVVSTLLFMGCPSTTKQVKKPKKDPVLNNPPPDQESYLEQANELYQQGRSGGNVNHKQVEKLYIMGLEKDPDNIKALYNLGALYEDMGKFQKASESFGNLLRKKPTHKATMVRLAQVYVRLKQYDYAKRMLERFVQSVPPAKRNKSILLNLASLQLAVGDTSQALKTARSILSKDKKNLSAYGIIARAYYRQKRYNSVLLLYQVVKESEIKKEDPGLLFVCAQASLRQKKLAKAVVFLKKAVGLKPNLFPAQMMLGRIAIKYFDPKSAIQAFSAAVRARSHSLEAWLLLALAYRMGGNYRKAEEVYTRRILGKGMKSSKALFNLGLLYFKKLRKFQKARKAFRKYIGDMGAQITSDHISYKLLEQVNKRIKFMEMIKKDKQKKAAPKKAAKK